MGGRTIYVTLVRETDGQPWRAEKVSIARPTKDKFLRGMIVGLDPLQFGIEAYYV
ncbi:MAG: hypothetical protein RMI91_03880 [Gemmatales bacterium]|nr:hypothetical protein [Gemmatales bacterium]MDW7993772.1 hypothetical protein [Gemmatales bacterium]